MRVLQKLIATGVKLVIGFSAMGLVGWGHLWIYLVANFLGGAVAAVVFKSLNPEDK